MKLNYLRDIFVTKGRITYGYNITSEFNGHINSLAASSETSI